MLNARNLMCMPPSCLSQHIASSNEKYGSLTFVSVEALLEQLTTGTTADKMIDLQHFTTPAIVKQPDLEATSPS